MSQSIAAVYENGVLRPLKPLSLPENTQVMLQIETTVTPIDPVFALIGKFNSDKALIDDIPVSEDPELYLAAEALGEQGKGLHAWEIAPERYARGEDGLAVRLKICKWPS